MPRLPIAASWQPRRRHPVGRPFTDVPNPSDKELLMGWIGLLVLVILILVILKLIGVF